MKRALLPALLLGALLSGGGAVAAPAVASGPALPDLSLSGELTQGGWARGSVPPGTRLRLGDTSFTADGDGSFFVAFDRDAPAALVLAATLPDGRETSRTLTIAPRAWAIERVATAKIPGKQPPEDFLRQRQGELAQIVAARGQATGAQGWRQRFTWPAKGRISGLFGAQRIYAGGEAGSYHSGIDIAGGQGGEIRAPADGVVILAAETPFTLEGHLLMVDHGSGLNSAFLHCSELLVHVGDTVRQGQVIARIGMTGRATGPHLHWSLMWRGSRLDPLLFTGPTPG